MERLKVTQGECKAYQSVTRVSDTLVGVAFFIKNKREVGKAYGKNEEEAIANANLYVNAHNTYNKCGKLPSELLEENRGLIEALKHFTDKVERGEAKSKETYALYKALLTKLEATPLVEPKDK